MRHLIQTLAMAALLGTATHALAGDGLATLGLGSPEANPMDVGFLQNKGQWDARALYYASAPNAHVWVTKTGIKYDFFRVENPGAPKSKRELKPMIVDGQVIEMKFANTTGAARPLGAGPMGFPVNFLKGQKAIRGVEVFKEAQLLNLYSGINLRLYKDQGQARYDLVVAPGADPSAIRFRYDGAQSVRVGTDGALRLGTRFGEIPIGDLKAYEETAAGNKAVDCRFSVGADGTVSFNVGSYNPQNTLVIDPIVFSTLLGAHSGDEIGLSVKSDSAGFPFVAGYTTSPFYPITNGAYDNTVAKMDGFVTKFARDAALQVFSTVIGGSESDAVLGMELDADGVVYLAGQTTSPDFPTTPGAADTTWAPLLDTRFTPARRTWDAFAFILSPDGSTQLMGTYLGGLGDEFVTGVGVDRNGNMYIGGDSDAATFPTTFGAFQTTLRGSYDAFVTKVTPTGTYAFSTLVGGAQDEISAGISVMKDGVVYGAGSTRSIAFPTTANALDRSVQQGDAYIFRLNSAGSAMLFSTVLGGSGRDTCSAMTTDFAGNVYVAGGTISVDFPRTLGVLDNVFSPGGENFMSKIAFDGSALIYSTFMAGGGAQLALAVDNAGLCYIAGGIGFPAGIALGPDTDDNSFNGPNDPLRAGDGYLQVLNEVGNAIVYASYIGGEEDETAWAVHVDAARTAFVTGNSNSYSQFNKVAFPTTQGVFKPSMINDNAPFSAIANPDSFLVKLKIRRLSVLNNFFTTPRIVAGGNRATGVIRLNQGAPEGGAIIQVTAENPGVAVPIDGNGDPLTIVTIPAGQTQGTFGIQTFDTLDPTVARFTVEYENDVLSTDLLVKPWLQDLFIGPTVTVGGAKLTGRVELLQPAPAGGLTVELKSSDVAKAMVVNAQGVGITTIQVPAGQSVTVFEMQSFGVDRNTSVDAGWNVSITAKIISPSLGRKVTKNFRILPANLQSVTFAPARINEDEVSVGTVRLDGMAGPSGIDVDLSLGTGAAPLTLDTAVVTIAKNTATQNFGVRAGKVSSDTSRNVIASRGALGQQRTGTIFVDANLLSSMVLSATDILGGKSITGVIKLEKPASLSGVNIPLTLNPPNGTSAFGTLSTNSVLVAPGATDSATFTLNTVRVNETRTITISATKPGMGTVAKTVTLRPQTFTFTLAPSPLVGGDENATGTVTMTETDANADTAVQLISSKPTALEVPGEVVIKAGEQSATFTATSKAVAATIDVTVTAKLSATPAAIAASQIIRILPRVPLLSGFTITPSSVTGGASATGTVTIDQPAGPSGLVVRITENNASTGSAFTTMPTSVTIPAGKTEAKFTIKTTVPSRTVGTQISVSVADRIFSATLTILRP